MVFDHCNGNLIQARAFLKPDKQTVTKQAAHEVHQKHHHTHPKRQRQAGARHCKPATQRQNTKDAAVPEENKWQIVGAGANKESALKAPEDEKVTQGLFSLNDGHSSVLNSFTWRLCIHRSVFKVVLRR